MAGRIHLEGAAELDRVLALLPEEIRRKVAGNALLAGGRIVAAEMRARTPVSAEAKVLQGRKGTFTRPPGFGKKNIRARLAKPNETASVMNILGGKSSAAVIAGPSPRAFYLKFLEFGWNLTRGSRGSSRIIRHISAKPFLRPAWEATKMAALQRIGERLGKGIEDAAVRLATQSYRNAGFSIKGRSLLRSLRRR